MKGLPFGSIHGEIFCHESEDLEKVKKAFKLFFSGKDIVQKTNAGAFGTSVKVLTANVDKRKAKNLAKKIFESLSKLDKKKILNEMKSRVSDNGKVYLKFDKQIAYSKEKMVLTDSEDGIKIILSLVVYPSNYANYLKVFRDIFS